MYHDKISAARILVVDDESLSRLLMDRMLKRDGHDVIFAESGEEALQQFIEKKPDLIFMDVMMGDMSGYDAAQRIKLIDVENYVPIIFLTSLADKESLVKCLESGGDDFITKPFQYEILKAKIHAALRTRVAYKKLQKQDAEVKLLHERLKWEQDVTETIFKQIIGERQPAIAGCRTYLSPAALSCGDFLLAAEVVEQPDTYQFIVGDFTGHGLSAAIGTLPVSNWFNEFVSEGRSIQETAYLLNSNLKKILPASHFCAVTLFQLDMRNGELQVINAGLPDLLIASEDDGIIKNISSSRLPLGIVVQDIGEFTPQFYSLHDGERLIAYTDGIIEATDILGEMFGSRRLEKIFFDHSAEQWFETIIEQVNSFQSKQYQRDDITLIEVAYSSENSKNEDNLKEVSDEHKLVSVGTAASMLDVSENTIRSWISNGVIKSTRKEDKRIVLRKKDIYAILQKRQEQSQSLDQKEISIVLVEDDAALLEIYSSWFHEIGMNINLITAASGYEGLLRIGQFLPEIVITDLMMPEMNGFELIHAIQNNEQHDECRIIAVSALTSQQIEDKGGLADDIILLKKPFTINELKNAVDGLLS
ncbi:MAG: response regulator [Chromatiales bacterium]|nr:response regulator [Chromatiales bacterium]